MKSWAFYCIKRKDFGNWKIKTDVYVDGVWFLVRFGAECDNNNNNNNNNSLFLLL